MLLSSKTFKLKPRIHLKFANDTKLFGKVQSELDNKSLQGDLQRLFDWAKEWQMEFNIDTCKVMHIGTSNKNFKY